MKENNVSRIFRFFVIFILAVHSVSGQSGGDFAVTRSVISNGGGQSSGGDFFVYNTIGQSIAGQSSSGGTFVVTAGFWNFSVQAPPPPPNPLVIVSGFALTTGEEGIKNVYVILTYPTGETQISKTIKTGQYSFENVPSGFTYVISASAKKITFSQPEQVVFISGNTANINFIANN